MDRNSDLLIWLTTPKARLAIRAGHKLGEVAAVLGHQASLSKMQGALNAEELEAYRELITLLARPDPVGA